MKAHDVEKHKFTPFKKPMFTRLKKSIEKIEPTPSQPVFGEKISFAAEEAYKLLRTNLMFSLPENNGSCCVIGVTSSIEGEGKSTTAINLGNSIAQTAKKVLLIDCDMRKPVLAKYLAIKTKPGLSNVLAGMEKIDRVIRESGLHENLEIVPVGDIPPNPAELLDSDTMKTMLASLKSRYDYIILDLPPVNAVTDALVASKYTDGMLIVIRQDYCVQEALDETIRQLNFLQVKILGFVMTKGSFTGHGYSRYGKYGKFGKYKYAYKSYKYGGYYGTAKNREKTEPPTEKKK